VRRLSLAGLWLAGFLSCVSLHTPGVTLERLQTSALPSEAEYLLVKPPSWESHPSRRFPVLYFLHDGYGDVLTLERRGVADDLTREMREGRLPEMIVVAPGAPGSWFADAADGGKRYETFILGELLPAIEATGRVVP